MGDQMKAVFITGAEEMGVASIPVPVPGPGQVRLAVDYVGVCGSDLHYFFEGKNGAFAVREPLTPGHELAGRIDLDPSGRWAVGTAVTVHPARFGTPDEHTPEAPNLWPGGSYLGSASTWPHTQGAMSEYLVVDAAMVRPLPSGLSVRTAVLAEPLAVALHAASRAGDLRGARVLVTGAGPIGLLAVVAARAAGAACVDVTDVLPGPLERAQAVGAREAINVRAREIEDSAYDVVLECSGVASSMSAAYRAARPAGVVVQVGMVPDEPRPINLAPVIAKELRVRGAFRFTDEIDAALTLLADVPSIASVITHEFELDAVTEAFAIARDSERSGKVIVALA